jgi:hypothetical protein
LESVKVGDLISNVGSGVGSAAPAAAAPAAAGAPAAKKGRFSQFYSIDNLLNAIREESYVIPCVLFPSNKIAKAIQQEIFTDFYANR